MYLLLVQFLWRTLTNTYIHTDICIGMLAGSQCKMFFLLRVMLDNISKNTDLEKVLFSLTILKNTEEL